MLRTPSEQTPESLFCTQCQTTPNAATSSALGDRVINREPQPPSTASGSSERISRVSTPPTEVSSTLSSPTFAPPPDPQETMRRRAQSDMASAEIGKRMLRGWAMLAEECPNEHCYGIPLVRPPKPGGGKDLRKECVVCSRVYIYEQDANGLDRLVPLQVPDHVSASVPSRNISSHIAPTSASMGVGTASQAFSRDKVNDHDPRQVESVVPETLTLPSTISTLNELIRSLEYSLHILAVRLASTSNHVPLDHVTVGEVAHSIEQVSSALKTVKHLHLQESSRHA